MRNAQIDTDAPEVAKVRGSATTHSDEYANTSVVSNFLSY